MASIRRTDDETIPTERVQLEDRLILLMRAPRETRYEGLRTFLLSTDSNATPEITCLTIAEMVRATDRAGGQRVARSMAEHCRDNYSEQHCATCPASRVRLLKAS